MQIFYTVKFLHDLNSASCNLYFVANHPILDISTCNTLLHIFYLMFTYSRLFVINSFQLFVVLGFQNLCGKFLPEHFIGKLIVRP